MMIEEPLRNIAKITMGLSPKGNTYNNNEIELKIDALLKNAGGGTFPNLRKDDLLNFKIISSILPSAICSSTSFISLSW